jgi:hypothetical protein
MTWRTITALAGVFAVLGVAAPASAQPEPRVPTELWKEYPLNPTIGEERQEPTTGEAPTATDVLTATVTSTPEPAANRQAARAPVEEEDGSIVLPLVVGLVGVGLFVIGGLMLLARRRTGSLDLQGAPRPLPSAPPQQSLRKRLSSESGLLVPFAEQAPPKATKASTRKKPPPRKDLPGLAPPPEKKRRVRSGLPPGKAIPPNPERPKPQSRRVGSRASKPEPKPRPAPKQEAEPASESVPEPRPEPVAEPPSVPPPPPQPLRAATSERGRAEECVVEWWRGYVKSDFYAVSTGPDGRTYVAARSRSFSWHKDEPPPQTGGAAEAHADLLASLAAAGWEATGGGAPWYRAQLRRPLRPTLRDLAQDV